VRSFATTKDRDDKAAKIDAVLRSALNVDAIAGYDMVDIGAGSGHIAAHFAQANNVIAADVENQITVEGDRLPFAQLYGDGLPFGAREFDIAILNQVLTYVPDPVHTLSEVKRILKPSGYCYIALPNRLFPLDPHSRVPFASYLPPGAYQALVNRIRGTHERVWQFDPATMRSLFETAGMSWHDFTPRVLHEPAFFHAKMPLPLPFWHWLTWISPTNIFVLKNI